MKSPTDLTDDPELRGLLRESAPAAALPPGFAANVWRRIEREENAAARTGEASWLDALANWLLAPRRVLAAAAALVLLGAIVGSLQGVGSARQAERDRYLAAVSPENTR